MLLQKKRLQSKTKSHLVNLEDNNTTSLISQIICTKKKTLEGFIFEHFHSLEVTVGHSRLMIQSLKGRNPHDSKQTSCLSYKKNTVIFVKPDVFSLLLPGISSESVNQ